MGYLAGVVLLRGNVSAPLCTRVRTKFGKVFDIVFGPVYRFRCGKETRPRGFAPGMSNLADCPRWRGDWELNRDTRDDKGYYCLIRDVWDSWALVRLPIGYWSCGRIHTTRHSEMLLRRNKMATTATA